METDLGQRVTSLEEICTSYKGQIEVLRNELKIMFAEVGLISSWISKRFGIDLIDNRFPNAISGKHNSSLELDILQTKSSLQSPSQKHFGSPHLTRQRSKPNSVLKSFRRKWRSTGSLNFSSKSISNSQMDDNVASDKVTNAEEAIDPHTKTIIHPDTPEPDEIDGSKPEDLSTSKAPLQKIQIAPSGGSGGISKSRINSSKIKATRIRRGDKTPQPVFPADANTKKESKRGRPKKLPDEKMQQPKAPIMLICHECGKVLKGAGSLRCHQKIHSNSRPYDCVHCSKKFRMKHHLDFHISSVHEAEGNKKWSCKFCNKGFLAKRDLQRHERSHTGERPFGCSYPNCTKSFNVKQHLTLHFRTHTGEKPYKCDKCQKCFTQANSLRIHRKIHSKVGGDQGEPNLASGDKGDTVLQIVN